MNFSASLVERTIVTVDYFINRAISGAWESVCRSALATLMRGPPDNGFVSDFLTVKLGFGCDIIGRGKGSRKQCPSASAKPPSFGWIVSGMRD
jgi:hypothetical protein